MLLEMNQLDTHNNIGTFGVLDRNTEDVNWLYLLSTELWEMGILLFFYTPVATYIVIIKQLMSLNIKCYCRDKAQ